MSDEEPTLSEIQRQIEEILRLLSARESRPEAGSRTAERPAGSGSSARWDDRDRTVIEALKVGETYTGRRIRRMYERLTDIWDPKKLKRRAKNLHNSELFDGDTFLGEGDPGSDG